MIAVTGASGQLGRLVIQELIRRVPANQIVAAVRSPARSSGLAAQGVHVREADYTRPDTLDTAFRGVTRVLLISAVEVGRKFVLHKAVIDAAQEAGVERLAYTSLLRADSSALILAGDHRQTEDYIRASGVPFAMLRNGWYLENHTSSLAAAVKGGAVIGSSGNGRFASASRADYAAAAAVVLMQPVSGNKTYELAGDHAFSMTELAAELSRQLGREVPYRNLSGEDYAATLLGAGLPQSGVDVILDADAQAIRGALDSTSHDLSELIGRPTTTLADAVRRGLEKASESEV